MSLDEKVEQARVRAEEELKREQASTEASVETSHERADDDALTTDPLVLMLTSPVFDELERLRDTGLYGSTLSDVAERVLCRAIERMQRRDY
jgi:hypothetical protein